MDKSSETILIAGIDAARDRVEIGVLGWAKVGHTASHMAFLFRKLGWVGGRSGRPAAPRPWLRQKKGRAAN